MTNDREHLGRLVRELWMKWARDQENPKPSWLTAWEHLTEPEREVDRQIGDGIAAEILRIFDEGRAAYRAGVDGGDGNPYGTTLGRIWFQGWEFAAQRGREPSKHNTINTFNVGDSVFAAGVNDEPIEGTIHMKRGQDEWWFIPSGGRVMHGAWVHERDLKPRRAPR